MTPTPTPALPVAGALRRRRIHFGAGFRLRRFLIVLGWILLPVLVLTGVAGSRPLHFISAAILTCALWPITARSGEILWEGEEIWVRRFFRFAPLDPGLVEAAVVTPPLFHRQSLVLRLRRPLHLSRYVYCRLGPETVCDAWALIYDRGWEPH